MTWTVVLSRAATKDAKKLARANLKRQVAKLLQILEEDPLLSPPFYKKLIGNQAGRYSRRINIQHRLVYEIDPDQYIVHVLRMWNHCE